MLAIEVGGGDKMRMRLQYSLRLILLVVALFATYFAWLSAVRSKNHSELAIDRINLEARLVSTQRWHDMLHDEVRQIPATSTSRLQTRTAALRKVKAEIVAMREELQAMQ
jgi:hypothetical protein